MEAESIFRLHSPPPLHFTSPAPAQMAAPPPRAGGGAASSRLSVGNGMGKHGQTGPTRADRPQSPQRQQRPRHSEGRVGSPPASGSCRRASEERGSGPEAPTGRAGGGARAGVGQPPNPHARCFPELLSRSWGRLAGRACLGARNLVWRPGCFGPSSSSRLPKLTHDRGSISRCSGGVRTPGRTGAKPAIPIDSSSTDTHDEITCL